MAMNSGNSPSFMYVLFSSKCKQRVSKSYHFDKHTIFFAPEQYCSKCISAHSVSKRHAVIRMTGRNNTSFAKRTLTCIRTETIGHMLDLCEYISCVANGHLLGPVLVRYCTNSCLSSLSEQIYNKYMVDNSSSNRAIFFFFF